MSVGIGRSGAAATARAGQCSLTVSNLIRVFRVRRPDPMPAGNTDALVFSSAALYPMGEDRIMTRHASHPGIVKRLKRAEGHLRAVIAMIEDGRPCLDLAQQLHAVESAVSNAKHALIHDHIEHCLDA